MLRACTTFGLFVTFATIGISQAPPLRSEAIESVTAGSFGVAPSGSGFVAVGSNYRARFEPGVVEFTPAAGATAPKSRNVRFTLDSLRRGSAAALTFDSIPSPKLDGARVSYDHTAGTESRWDVSESGVELSVRIASKPAGSGDLAVRFAIDTDFTADAAADARRVAFEAGAVGVSIGEVFGVDARSERVRGWFAYDGERYLDLVIPAEFVERATFPLLVDPPVTAELPIAGPGPHGRPEIAYDVTHDVYLVVWEFELSASDHDILVHRLDGSGQRIGGLFPLAGTSEDERAPQVASLNQTDQFVIAWQAQDASGDYGVYGGAVRAADGFYTGPRTIADVAGVDEWSPDVMGDRTQGTHEALVFCFSANEILYWPVSVDANSSLSIGASTRVTNSSFAQVDNTLSVPSDRNTGRFVVYEDSILFRGVRITGNLWCPPLITNAQNPKFESDGQDLVLVYEKPEPGDPTRSDVYMATLFDTLCSPPLVLPTLGVREYALETDPGDDERDPTISVIRPRTPGSEAAWLIAWADERNTAPGTHDVKAVEVEGSATLRRCGIEWTAGPQTGADVLRPALASEWSGGAAASDDALLVYESTNLASSNRQIQAQGFDTSFGLPVVDLGGGCGLAGTQSSTGEFVIGGRDFRLELQGAAGGASLTVLGFRSGGSPAVIPCGPCQILDFEFLTSSRPVVGGAASVPLTLGCETIDLFGVTFDTQFLVLTPNAAPCLGIGVSWSNRLRMTLSD